MYECSGATGKTGLISLSMSAPHSGKVSDWCWILFESWFIELVANGDLVITVA